MARTNGRSDYNEGTEVEIIERGSFTNNGEHYNLRVRFPSGAICCFKSEWLYS